MIRTFTARLYLRRIALAFPYWICQRPCACADSSSKAVSGYVLLPDGVYYKTEAGAKYRNSSSLAWMTRVLAYL